MASNTRMCGPCDRDKEKRDASFWCETCSEDLCQNCLKEHKKNRASSNHKVIPVEDLTKEFESTLSLNDLCDKHDGKIISLYCVSHDQLCCSTCLNADHRQCADIVTVEDVATSATQSTALEDLQARVDDTSSIFDIILKEKNENVIGLETQAKEHEKQLSRTKQLLMLQLNKAEASSKEEMEVKKKICLNKITEDTNYIRKKKSALEDLQRNLKFLKQSGSNKQVFINVKRLDVVQNNLEQELLILRDKLLKKYQLMLLSPSTPTISIGPMLSESKIETNVMEGVPEFKKHQQCQILSSIDDGMLELTEKINLHDRFGYMNVWKLCYFEEHNKLAIGSSNLVYVYDMQSKLVSIIEVNKNGIIWYIDKYDTNHALVAICGEHLLFKVNIFDSKVHKIEVNLKNMLGEAICVNSHIVVRNTSENFLILKNGLLLREIPFPTSEQNCLEDSYGGYICGYGENKFIYSSYLYRTVGSITLEGQHVFQLILENHPMGIAVDKNDFIYVGSTSGIIHKITPAGKLVKTMSCGPKLIKGMTYKKSTHEIILIIDDDLEIYKLP